MSLSGALNSSVSALKAQSTAIATVSDNLANSSTYGYKTTVASFESLVTGASSSSYSSGGVLSNTRSNISAQGQLTRTSSTTDLAIEGNGFLTVTGTAGSNEKFYTRNGEFSKDNNGYLVNNGYFLMGWRTDADGNVIGAPTAGNLESIDTNVITSCAAPTTEVSMSANLPANAAVGDTFETTLEIYDSLGTSALVSITWEKTGIGTWEATFSDPVLSSDGTTVVGTSMATPIAITFNSDGSIASAAPTTLSITGWTTGAANSAISLDLGDPGSFSGLTQQSVDGTIKVDLGTIEKDGLSYGSLSGISIEDGIVYASYSNGAVRSIYQIAVATFTNANGLQAESGGLYRESGSSGSATMQLSGSGGAGTVNGSTLEASKTDTSEEFSVMISAQQAYSASAQVISTVSTMYDTLISAMR
ncbi:flagellar hook protein FlgE [Blastochloris sulfoviridis]|uniref:Flagellar hook protein FlgE n=1 Tax=Blastochloris sulfoviridis TaxID=50712 RepID=A0A5M6I3X0_9HYPH|nr:flagellar hook protein FlgE [Blastochloris sulfoviridis]KAA5602557.1 flagellar hook protein FlgE [Blastochloris sulfoviridis]